MGYHATGEVWIPVDDWYEFVRKYLPEIRDAELSLGPPTANEDGITVPFAANTECHPSEQLVPPDWCKKSPPVSVSRVEQWTETYMIAEPAEGPK